MAKKQKPKTAIEVKKRLVNDTAKKFSKDKKLPELQVPKRALPEYINIEILSEKEDKDNAILYNRVQKLLDDYKFFYIKEEDATINLGGFPHHSKKAINNLTHKHNREAAEIRKSRFLGLRTYRARLTKRLNKLINGDYEYGLETQKAEIVELFAQNFSAAEVHKQIQADWGFDVNYNSIVLFFKKYRSEIEKLQLDYEKDFGQIGISKKRSRLEILDYMARRTKQYYSDEEGQKMLPYSRELRDILEQARKEVEGNQIKLDISGHIDITATIESVKTTEELYSDINFMTLLISRVAARQRTNPLMIQYQLTQSWYAKYNGIKRNKSLMEETPDYPSKIILNWDTLQRKIEKKEQESISLMNKFNGNIEDVTPVNGAIELRRTLLKKIREKQAGLDESKQRVISAKRNKDIKKEK